MKIDKPSIKKEVPKPQTARLKFHVLCMYLFKYVSVFFRQKLKSRKKSVTSEHCKNM